VHCSLWKQLIIEFEGGKTVNAVVEKGFDWDGCFKE
jgi:hypothetical protein